MKAIILAAGKSTRLAPHSLTIPKPLMPLLGTTLIENVLENLTGLIDEAIVVVGYKSDMIQAFLGDQYQDIKITYVIQPEFNGTYGAVKAAQGHVSGNFIIINSDDLYDREDIEKCIKHDLCILGSEHTDPSRFGCMVIKDNVLEKIIEKPDEFSEAYVNTGLVVVDERVFDFVPDISPRGELELTDVITQLHPVVEIATHDWFAVSYPWNLLEANVLKLRTMQSHNQGHVEKGVTIKGEVFIGKDTLVKSGSYIEGPVYIGNGVTIGPSAYIRPGSVIRDRVHIGYGVEIVDSIIMDGTIIKHRSYVGHSIIGRDVNIGAGFITSDYRHDANEIGTLVKGEKVNSYRKKLGSFIGDSVKTAVHTSLYPGRKIWPGLTTVPGEIIVRDKME